MDLDKQGKFSAWILFILWPFLMFLVSLRNIEKRDTQVYFLLFAFLYGYSVYLFSGDILNYEQAFHSVVEYGWDDFTYLLLNSLSPDKHNLYEINSLNNKPDIYALVLSFIVSRFTENPRWFWGFASLIFSYTFINFINSFKVYLGWTADSIVQKILFFTLVFIVPFYVGVTGIRFWPALFIFVTYALNFLNKKDFKYFLLASSSILFHYSFLFPSLLLLLIFFLPNSRYIFRIIFFVSLLIALVSSTTGSLAYFRASSDYFEETAVESSIDAYSNEEVLESRKIKYQNANWYKKMRTESVFFFFVFVGILDVFGIFRFKENKFLLNIYPVFVIFLALTVLTYNLGSISRFKNVFYLIFLTRYSILAGIQPFDIKLRTISYCLIPIMTIYVLVSFRAGFYTVEPTLIINNLIGVFFVHSNVSLSEFLIGH